MIKVRIISVGNLKEKYLKDAQNEYLKRLSRFCKIEVLEIPEQNIPKNASQADIKNVLDKEASAIKNAIIKNSFVISLCIEGVLKSSEDFAKEIENILVNNSALTFIIGSSYGLSNEIKSLSDLKLSVSKMTYPHQLMRIILLEQFYRAFKINYNENYHK